MTKFLVIETVTYEVDAPCEEDAEEIFLQSENPWEDFPWNVDDRTVVKAPS